MFWYCSVCLVCALLNRRHYCSVEIALSNAHGACLLPATNHNADSIATSALRVLLVMAFADLQLYRQWNITQWDITQQGLAHVPVTSQSTGPLAISRTTFMWIMACRISRDGLGLWRHPVARLYLALQAIMVSIYNNNKALLPYSTCKYYMINWNVVWRWLT